MTASMRLDLAAVAPRAGPATVPVLAQRFLARGAAERVAALLERPS